MMQFRFQGFDDFLLMSGHGVFVWTCYIAVTMVFLYLCMAPVFKARALVRDLQQQQKIMQRRQQQSQQSVKP